MRTTLFLILHLALVSFAFAQVPSTWQIFSPNSRLQTTVQFQDGQLSYTISAYGKSILKKSALGIEFLETELNNWSTAVTSVRSFKEDWKAVWGANKNINNAYNELAVLLKNGSHNLHVQFRVFNDGVAFRYVLPAQPGLASINIRKEKSEFAFADNLKGWWQPKNFNTDEQVYRTGMVSDIRNANTPVTFQRDNNIYVSLHEAALTNYSQMTLDKYGDSTGLTFITDLVPWPDGIKVKLSNQMTTPWRTITITNNLDALVHSNLLVNLNEPSKIANPAWIKPGKYMGIWWQMHLGAKTWFEGDSHGATTPEMKRYIDFAAKNKFQAVLAEGWNKGWKERKDFSFTESYPDYDLPELAAYAHKQNVDLIVHNETSSDILNYEQQLDSAFALYSRLGIHHVKTGYVGQLKPAGLLRHGQYMVAHYRKVVETAARYQIMLDVHEPVMATGESRTYPNMMTREGVRGMEFEAWSTGLTATHNCTIPFTRMLAGPLDYNPGIFDLLYRNADSTKLRTIVLKKPQGIVRVHTTLAHQLALFIVLYSPLQMAPDLIENYEGQPAFNFLKNATTDWDESRLLAGAIGEYALMARRNGSRWFIGGITNESGRQLSIPLTFLKPGKTYTATIYRDDVTTTYANPYPIKIEKRKVKTGELLTVKLAGAGGVAVEITD